MSISKIKLPKEILLISILILSNTAHGFDKFDNEVCESASDDPARISCFQELAIELKPTCKTNLTCYRIEVSKILSNQHSSSAKQSEKATKPKILDNHYLSRISQWVLTPYTVERGFSKTVARFGPRLAEIEQFRKNAAIMALDSGKCDFVEMSELSDKSSLEHLQFWVDCTNKNRIRLDEKEITSDASIQTEADKSWKEGDAKATCNAAIKDNSLIPSSVNIHSIIGTAVRKVDITQTVVVDVDFDATNSFGVELQYTAHCLFSPGKPGEISIKQK